MRGLEAGHRLNPDDIGPIAAISPEPIVITGTLGPTPLGTRYRAKHAGRSLLVSVFDRELLADPITRRRLEQGLGQATSATHSRILPTHGFTFEGVIPFAVHDDPRCTTVAEFVERRLKKAKLPSLRTAMRLVDQACEALEYLHPNAPHGLLSGHTTFVDAQGQLRIFGLGEGGAAWRSLGYRDQVGAGHLPRPGDEVDPSREPMVETDVYLLAAFMVEILTGKPYQDPRQLDALRTTFARQGVDLLLRALAPRPNARPNSVATFRSALQSAMAATPAKARGSSMSRVSHASTLTTLSQASQLGQLGAGPPRGYGSQVTPLPGRLGPPGPPPGPPAGYGPGHGTGHGTGPYPPVGHNTGPHAAVPGYVPTQHTPMPAPRLEHSAELSLEAAERMGAQPDPYAGTSIGPGYRPPEPGYRPPAPGYRGPGPGPGPGAPGAPRSPSAAPDFRGPPPGPPAGPGPGLGGGNTGELNLGLGLGDMDELAGRLSSIDGAAEQGLQLADGIDNSGTPGTQSTLDSGPVPLTEEEFEIKLRAEDPKLRVYLHVKDGVERGPFAVVELVQMAETGQLTSVEELVHRELDRGLIAASHPKLRPIFLKQAEAKERAERDAAKVQQAARDKEKHGRSTVVLIVVILALFGAAAAWVVLR